MERASSACVEGDEPQRLLDFSGLAADAKRPVTPRGGVPVGKKLVPLSATMSAPFCNTVTWTAVTGAWLGAMAGSVVCPTNQPPASSENCAPTREPAAAPLATAKAGVRIPGAAGCRAAQRPRMRGAAPPSSAASAQLAIQTVVPISSRGARGGCLEARGRPARARAAPASPARVPPAYCRCRRARRTRRRRCPRSRALREP